jgi:hypothetical protein
MTASKPHNFGLLLVLDLDRGSFKLNRVDFHDSGAGLNGIHRVICIGRFWGEGT